MYFVLFLCIGVCDFVVYFLGGVGFRGCVCYFRSRQTRLVMIGEKLGSEVRIFRFDVFLVGLEECFGHDL